MSDPQPWSIDGLYLDTTRASVREFIEEDYYLGMRQQVFPTVVDTLEEIIQGSYDEAVVCWGIGSGKSFLGSLALCYMAHSLLCVRDPQKCLGLAPGSPITLLTVAPSARQARDIVFGEVTRLVEGSPWFRDHAPDAKALAEELRLPKGVRVVAGNSSPTFALGLNVIGAVVDEVAFFPSCRTEQRETVETIYGSLRHRMSSRFGGRGLLLLISSPGTVDDFLQRRLAAAREDEKVLGTRKPVWQVRPREQYSGVVFRHKHLAVPMEYERDFKIDPVRAMRDLAAYPTAALCPFLVDSTTIERAITGTMAHPFDAEGRLLETFVPRETHPRFLHVDLGLRRDACGIAMAFCRANPRAANEPVAVVELMQQLTAPPGGEIDLSRPRELILALRDRGFNISQVSFDGWQSADSRQILERRGIRTKLVSVDRTLEAYETLREVVVDGRLSTYRFEPLLSELRSLELVDGRKVDHPPGGSKDVADAVAGCVSEAIKAWRGTGMTARIV